MVKNDFPTGWPSFAGQIKEFLETEDQAKIWAGLLSLKSVCQKYEYEFDKGRDGLNEIADHIFP